MNIVNSVQPLQILSMAASGAILGLQRKTKTKHADAFQIYYIRCFEDFDILINKGFLNDKRI